MTKLFLYIFVSFMFFLGPRAFADISSNTDFDPFPQMEQDVNNTNDQAAPEPQDQNDGWPPANSQSQADSGGQHE